ncbi:MAG: hypothetical protein R2778_14330 [Saprospiraceae bacterium]
MQKSIEKLYAFAPEIAKALLLVKLDDEQKHFMRIKTDQLAITISEP